jgi:hypothetical protein
MTKDQIDVSKYDVPEELKSKTSAYPVVDVKVAPVPLKTVPDIATGGERVRRFGLVMSVAAIPDLSSMQQPLMLDASIGTMMFDADSLDELQERAIAEIKSIIAMTKDQLEAAENAEVELQT